MSVHRSLVVLVAALALSGLSGCGDATSGDDGTSGAGELDQLDGRAFTADHVTDPERDLVAGSTLRVTFDHGRIGVSAGCNSMSGTARLERGVLVVGALAGTEMGCAADLMDQDAWLSTLLTDRPTLTVAGDVVTLTRGDTSVTLTEYVEKAAPLQGTHWVLESVGVGTGPDGTVGSVPAGVTAWLELDGTRLRFSDGCNGGTGYVTVEGDQLRIADVSMTDSGCPEGGVQDSVRAALQPGSTPYVVDGQRLVLTAPDGDRVTFRAAAAP